MVILSAEMFHLTATVWNIPAIPTGCIEISMLISQQKMITNVTYLKLHEIWYYLTAYLDLYSNKFLEWELSGRFDNF